MEKREAVRDCAFWCSVPALTKKITEEEKKYYISSSATVRMHEKAKQLGNLRESARRSLVKPTLLSEYV